VEKEIKRDRAGKSRNISARPDSVAQKVARVSQTAGKRLFRYSRKKKKKRKKEKAQGMARSEIAKKDGPRPIAVSEARWPFPKSLNSIIDWGPTDCPGERAVRHEESI